MIVFRNDRFVPPALCELLSGAVPLELHCPVVFHSRGGERRQRGVIHGHAGGGPLIEIYLQRIFECEAAFTWRELVEVCLHEFGHVATYRQLDPAKAAGYAVSFDAHGYVERPAIAWQARRTDELLDRDARLFQPFGFLTGYLGARHARMMRHARTAALEDNSGSGRALWVDERRCANSGGQLTIGQVLGRVRELNPWANMRAARRLVRRHAADLGIAYVDGAGRRHQLYTWRDLREIQRRLRAALQAGTVLPLQYPPLPPAVEEWTDEFVVSRRPTA